MSTLPICSDPALSVALKPWCVLLESASGAGTAKVPPTSRDASEARHTSEARDMSELGTAIRKTFSRAMALTGLERVKVVTARREKPSSLPHCSSRHLIMQPSAHGSASAILLALLSLQDRVAQSTPIIFMPTDSVVREEEILRHSLEQLSKCMQANSSAIYLLGVTPESPDERLGYIVPWYNAVDLPMGVYEFVEGPSARRARQLINDGGLWNTFIFGGTIGSLIDSFRPRFGALLDAMRAIVDETLSMQGLQSALSELYQRFPPADFSKDVLTSCINDLRLLRVPTCGWRPLRA
jgi:mannose-1-phosphate guanylyltransferase